MTKVAGLTSAAPARRGGGLPDRPAEAHMSGGRRLARATSTPPAGGWRSGSPPRWSASTSASSRWWPTAATLLAIQLVPGLTPRHPAGRPGDRRSRGCSPGSTCAGRRAHYDPRLRALDREQPTVIAGRRRHRHRPAQRRRDGVLLRLHRRHARHHLVGGAAHPHHRAVLRRRPHGQRRARTASRWPATT